jgi:predicted nucleic acid-binding protein
LILLDTNVVSETMRRLPAPRVIDWLNAQAAETIYLSTVSLAELLLGIAVLPDGRRKTDLASSLAERTATLFGARLVPFDTASARAYAAIVSQARAAGRAVGVTMA